MQCIVVPWYSDVSPIISSFQTWNLKPHTLCLEIPRCRVLWILFVAPLYSIISYHIISYQIISQQYPKSYSIFDRSIIPLYIYIHILFISHDGVFYTYFLGATSWHGQRSFPEENRPRAIFRSPELRRRRMLGPELSGTLSQEEWVQARLTKTVPCGAESARFSVILTQHAVRWVMSSSYVRALNHELVWEYKWIYIYIRI